MNSHIQSAVVVKGKSYVPLNLFVKDSTTGAYSALCDPITATMSGELPPALTLKTGSPDSNGNPTITWELPTAVDSGVVRFYRIVRKNGKDVAILGPGGIDILDKQASLPSSFLSEGPNQIFAVYEGQGDYGLMNGSSDYSNTLQIQYSSNTPPMAPVSVFATINAGVNPAQRGSITLSWTNSSGNETGFQIWRKDDTAGAFTQVAERDADQTTFTEQLGGLGPWTYEVRAVNASGKSQFTVSNNIALRGGAYELNRMLGATSTSTHVVRSNYNLLTHTFCYTTDVLLTTLPSGKLVAVRNVEATYSWGNASGLTSWHKNQPEDIRAATEAISSNYLGWQFGVDDPRFNNIVDMTYQSLLGTDVHWNLIVGLNCKFAAGTLEEQSILKWEDISRPFP